MCAGKLASRGGSWIVVLLSATLAAAGACPAAAQPAVDASINAPFADPDVDYWRSVFESDRREIYRYRFDILDALAIEPGMAVADVGAGTGFFSLMFAKKTAPGGRVFAVDIAANFVAAIERRAAAAGIANLEGVVNDAREVRLPPESVDLVFISDTYHHFEYPAETLLSIHRALRPGGSLVIVDFRVQPGVSNAWVMHHVRAGADQVRSEVEAAGFAFVEQRDFMPTQYYLRFRKDEPR